MNYLSEINHQHVKSLTLHSLFFLCYFASTATTLAEPVQNADMKKQTKYFLSGTYTMYYTVMNYQFALEKLAKINKAEEIPSRKQSKSQKASKPRYSETHSYQKCV